MSAHVTPMRDAGARLSKASAGTADVAVVVLTHNEEINIARALTSAAGWARELFVLDSFSTDRTVEIATELGCIVKQNPFVDFGSQRNYALEQLGISAAWVLFLDADEWLPEELKREIGLVVASDPAESGFMIKRRLIWMGTWIRRGYYPTWILRLFRRGHGRCEDRTVNEHIVVDGPVGHLASDFMHEDQRPLSQWIMRHDAYAIREAHELVKAEQAADRTEASMPGHASQAGRKRWLRERVWNRMPPLIRPWVYFFYRYILTGGFLDGRVAFTYHFLQALWFPMLIDIRYLAARRLPTGAHSQGQ